MMLSSPTPTSNDPWKDMESLWQICNTERLFGGQRPSTVGGCAAQLRFFLATSLSNFGPLTPVRDTSATGSSDVALRIVVSDESALVNTAYSLQSSYNPSSPSIITGNVRLAPHLLGVQVQTQCELPHLFFDTHHLTGTSRMLEHALHKNLWSVLKMTNWYNSQPWGDGADSLTGSDWRAVANMVFYQEQQILHSNDSTDTNTAFDFEIRVPCHPILVDILKNRGIAVSTNRMEQACK